MLTGMEQIITAAETCNLACTDLLMNLDRVPKTRSFDLLCSSKSPAKKVGVSSRVMLV